MKKLSVVLLVISCLWYSCSPKTRVQKILSTNDIVIGNTLNKFMSCNDQLNYIPDSLTRMKYLRVNVHFMDDSTGTKNFTLEEGKSYMTKLINNANKRLKDNRKMKLPVGNTTPNLPINYRYKIMPSSDDPDDDGFYKHLDNDLYYFLNKGKHRNNYNRDVIKKYNIGGDSIINIFVLPHHPDSVKSDTYKPHRTGIALGSDLKVAGMVEDKKTPWKFATLLNHEIGHILGLSHSWVRNDRCDDTPSHSNCWDESREGCVGKVSNNMMDYNNSQMAISPCQLGIINKGFSKLNHKNRKLVEVDWCHKEDEKEILISGTVQWSGAKDVQRNIRVLSGSVFEVSCRIGMPKNSKIIVEPGAILKLHNSYLHNACGLKWDGIELLSKGETSGILEANGNVRMEDVEDGTVSNLQ